MTEKNEMNARSILSALGIERGIIIGTDKEGNTKTYLMAPLLQDLAVYTKVIDRQILTSMDKEGRE